jgi:hypothetical protein
MTLKREKPKPVDWARESRARIEEEHGDWTKHYIAAVLRRCTMFEYLEENVPADNGKRSRWKSLDWFIGARKIPWAPRGFLG